MTHTFPTVHVTIGPSWWAFSGTIIRPDGTTEVVRAAEAVPDAYHVGARALAALAERGLLGGKVTVSHHSEVRS